MNDILECLKGCTWFGVAQLSPFLLIGLFFDFGLKTRKNEVLMMYLEVRGTFGKLQLHWREEENCSCLKKREEQGPKLQKKKDKQSFTPQSFCSRTSLIVQMQVQSI